MYISMQWREIMGKEKFYITTAIAYTSRKPHIGNTFEIVFTDAIAKAVGL